MIVFVFSLQYCHEPCVQLLQCHFNPVKLGRGKNPSKLIEELGKLNPSIFSFAFSVFFFLKSVRTRKFWIISLCLQQFHLFI